jgi:hypothetical protein
MRIRLKYGLCFLIVLIFGRDSYAQFTLDGQILQRAEFRQGFARLMEEEEEVAAFIAHRARLQAKYTTENFTFYMSIQDVRTWGNTPQVKATDNFLSVHEAWAETHLGSHWKLKLGRQELNYDNFRFLGNLDWALQGRAHDFALLKYEKEDMKFHAGGGYNQDQQVLTGNLFTIPNQYKTAQMARYENKFGNLHLSLLFWNDGRQWVARDANAAIIDKGTRYRSTIGVPTLRYQKGRNSISGFYYHQLGKDVVGNKLGGFDASAQYTREILLDEEKGKKIRLLGGFEVISGNSSQGPAGNNRAFSPLYGTNHIFNGYMDYFFVGGMWENSVGLQDYFIKSRIDFSPKLFTQLDAHWLYSYGKILSESTPDTFTRLDPLLGVELDFTLGYIINEAVSLQAGYSQLFASSSLSALQSTTKARHVQNWAYVMMIYRPTMKNRFVGILF